MSKRIVLTMSEAMYADLEKLASTLGITPLEYIRHLIINDKELKDKEK